MKEKVKKKKKPEGVKSQIEQDIYNTNAALYKLKEKVKKKKKPEGVKS